MTYFTFGAMLMVIAVIARIAFSCIDLKEDDPLTEPLISEEAILDAENENASTQAGGQIGEAYRVTYMDLLKCPRILFSFTCCALSNVVFANVEPIMAIRMLDFNLTSV